MTSRRARRLVCLLVLAGVALFIVIAPRRAEAYPWMIRHGYLGCVPCHADPSGSGLLTEYGRAQADLLLRTRFGGSAQSLEPTRAAEFFWYWKLPDWLLLTVSHRDGVSFMIDPNAPAAQRVTTTFLLMQADAKVQVAVSRLRVSGTLGYLWKGGQGAWITNNLAGNNLVSREHWLGLDIGEDKSFLLRAGRLEVPFGIRQVEHPFLVRQATQTDLNDTQQHGVALAYSGDPWRGEVMAIAGNFQIGPDEVRSRGYSGFVELSLGSHAAVGVSSKTTYAKKDLTLGYGAVRMAHGAFTRLALAKWAVVLSEADALVVLPTDKNLPVQPDGKLGGVAMTQVDFEPTQGVHVMPTFEVQKLPETHGVSLDAWASVVWFFTWHADVRVDFVDEIVSTGPSQVHAYVVLPQLHAYF